MSPTKKILIALGVVTVLLVGAAVVFGGEDGSEVETAEARVRALTETVTASGQVSPEVDVAIASDVSGEIVLLAVEEGDRVEKGQLLLRIRPDFYASQTEQAQAGVAQARSGIGEAQSGVGEARGAVAEAQAAVGEAQAAVAEAQAGIEQARREAGQATAERERAERALERQQDLFDRDVVSAMDLEAARGAADVARAAEDAALGRIRAAQDRVAIAQSRVRSARSRVGSTQQRVRSQAQRVQSARAQAASAAAQARQARQQLDQTAIYAPMSGTVSVLNVELGERVVGTAQMQGTELLRIARLDAMTLEADVNENDVVNIEVGDSARVEIDAYPDEALVGVVSRIANSARVSGAGTAQAVTNFPVEVRIGGVGDAVTESLRVSADEGGPRAPALRLRPGMSGTVDVFTQRSGRAVVVPIQAVAVRDVNELRREKLRHDGAPREDIEAVPEDEDLRRVVFVVEDGEALMREVTTGLSDDTHIEITSGLAGGERVVTGPFALLRTELADGDPVREKD